MTNQDEQLLQRFNKALGFAQTLTMCIFAFVWSAAAFPSSSTDVIPYLAGMAIIFGLIPIGVRQLFILFVMIMAEGDDSD